MAQWKAARQNNQVRGNQGNLRNNLKNGHIPDIEPWDIVLHNGQEASVVAHRKQSRELDILFSVSTSQIDPWQRRVKTVSSHEVQVFVACGACSG